MHSPFRHIGSVFWKSNPIQLTFFLTRECNSRCAHCFYLSGDRSKKGQRELSMSEIDKLSSSIGKLLWLAFSGGEIFLKDNLVEVTRLFYEKNKPAFILLPTNGSLSETVLEKTEEIVKSCPKSVVTLKLSIDGAEELHDTLRGVKGSYKKVRETYEALRPLLDKYDNFELGVNTVFCSKNQSNMDEIIESVKTMKSVKTHTVSMIRGDVVDEELKNIDIDKYLETIETLEAGIKNGDSGRYSFRGGAFKAAQDIVSRRLINDTFRQGQRAAECFAGRLTLVLTETGDLFPCESFSMRIGNVREWDYDIKKMLKSDRSREILASIKSKECCCTHECYFMMNILFNPLMYPSLLKERLMMG